MTELSLQEIKEIEFGILKEFDAFCKANGIRYFISHGTLLGAIRYKGFIPWDDDIDVLVPREDYDRLLSIYPDSGKYHLYAFEKDSSFLFPYAKLVDTTTRKVEPGYDNGTPLGLDIDVFPLDAWADDREQAKKEVAYIRRNTFFLTMTKIDRPGSANPAKRFVKGIVMRFCKCFGSEHYLRKILAQCVKHSRTRSAFLGNKAWCVYGERDILPAETFSEAVEIEFEGERFPAPVGYDTFLSSLYGDYLPEPPKEKQKTHHVFKAYRL